MLHSEQVWTCLGMGRGAELGPCTEQAKALYRNPLPHAFWIAQVPFAFGFECDWPNGNLVTVTKLPFVRFGKSWLNGWMAIWWQTVAELSFSCSTNFSQIWRMVIRWQRVKLKRNLRYFKFTLPLWTDRRDWKHYIVGGRLLISYTHQWRNLRGSTERGSPCAFFWKKGQSICWRPSRVGNPV